MPKISVVMPTYNAEKYLREAVKSILDQTFSDFEFLVIDDKSSDKTLEILESYSDERIQVVTGPCCGIAAALNTGLDLAKGEYIARMDADDISFPERFERQVRLLEEKPEVGLCGSLAMQFCDEGDIGLWAGRSVEHPGLFDLLSRCVVCHPSVMFRRELFEFYGLRYNQDWTTTEDQELWARAMRYIEFYNIQEVLLRYRVHPQGASIAKSDKGGWDNLCRVHKDILDWLFPGIDYPCDGTLEVMAEKMIAVAESQELSSFYIDRYDFSMYPRWKRIIAMSLFDRDSLKKEVKKHLTQRPTVLFFCKCLYSFFRKIYHLIKKGV
ncbi:glycosyltransferase [Aminipila luticellarii]|uniref:Glycosyltransferase n=1 Tax=Aminipila luticellarii TaxID=2507160 RepID=A0A410PSF4_9FIRM|nr:glycosyltransferase [Aminipila luticellarii]QAT41917.1 glycosyltransferase [Aminipila luticellarii]